MKCPVCNTEDSVINTGESAQLCMNCGFCHTEGDCIDSALSDELDRSNPKIYNDLTEIDDDTNNYWRPVSINNDKAILHLDVENEENVWVLKSKKENGMIDTEKGSVVLPFNQFPEAVVLLHLLSNPQE